MRGTFYDKSDLMGSEDLGLKVDVYKRQLMALMIVTAAAPTVVAMVVMMIVLMLMMVFVFM